MRIVWKYTVDLTQGLEPVINIPMGAQFLAIKEAGYTTDAEGIFQSDEPKFDTWWLVESELETVPVRLHVIGTGADEIPTNVIYLGTIFPMAGLVLHVWQEVEWGEPPMIIFEDIQAYEPPPPPPAPPIPIPPMIEDLEEANPPLADDPVLQEFHIVDGQFVPKSQ